MMRKVDGTVGTDRPSYAAGPHEKLRGAALYGADLLLPDTLCGKILLSDVPHARIKRIDLSGAERLSGVRAVVTALDFPSIMGGGFLLDRPMSSMASDRIRYAGEPVAAVAAEDEATALEALRAIQIEYDELPAVLDHEQAFADSSVLVHETMGSYDVGRDRKEYVHPQPGTNICHHYKIRKGDVEAGLRSADVVLEATYRVPRIHHAPMEPHACLAQATDDRILVYASSQAPHMMAPQLAQLFGLPLERIRFVASTVGGGFGNKIRMLIEPIAVRLSQKAGRPVRIALDRYEEFVMFGGQHPVTIAVKTGARNDGTLVAHQVTLLWDGGAYCGSGWIPATYGGMYATSVYSVQNIKIDSYLLYTNTVTPLAHRTFGPKQVGWAIESHMDELARRLGIDSLEFRLKNLGHELATGEDVGELPLRECLEEAARTIGWGQSANRSENGTLRGVGIAGYIKASQPSSPSHANVEIDPDGAVTVRTGVPDIGQGSNLVLAQIAARVLGVDWRQVRVISGDTRHTPSDPATLSNRVTYHSGNAVKLAGEDVRNKLLDLSSEMLEADRDDLEIVDGQIGVKGSPSRRLRVGDVAERFAASFPLQGDGLFRGHGSVNWDTETGQVRDSAAAFWDASAAGVEVEVDPQTGEITINRLVVVVDPGMAINRKLVEEQVIGGAAMGVGMTLYEEQLYSEGHLENASFMYYVLPSVEEVPTITPILAEQPYRDGPFGAKGMAEGPLLAVAPAIGNAVREATGTRICDLPLTAERVWQALRLQHREVKEALNQ